MTSMPPPSTCRPEAITAWVDDALEPAQRGGVEAHLAACAACREQEAFERGLRTRLRSLPAPEMPEGFEGRLRQRARRPARRSLPVWIGVAAGLFVAALWVRNAGTFVALELSRDHAHCFGRERLDAQVWTEDPGEIARWFADRGVPLPVVPARAGGLEMVGGRLCPLVDRRVAHVFYATGKKTLSLYVVPGAVRVGSDGAHRALGRPVQLLRTGGRVVGLVSDDAAALEEFRKAFATTVATIDPLPPALVPWVFTPVGL